MEETQNTDNITCCGGCGAAATLIHCWWKCKTLQALWNTVWQFLAKLNIFLPYDTAIELLGIYSNKLKEISTQKPLRGCL